MFKPRPFQLAAWRYPSASEASTPLRCLLYDLLESRASFNAKAAFNATAKVKLLRSTSGKVEKVDKLVEPPLFRTKSLRSSSTWTGPDVVLRLEDDAISKYRMKWALWDRWSDISWWLFPERRQAMRDINVAQQRFDLAFSKHEASMQISDSLKRKYDAGLDARVNAAKRQRKL